MKTRRRGWTLVELLVVLAIVGVLATIVMPYYWETRYRAIAASIISDYNTVRVSALSYHATNAALPATNGWGVTPPEFKPMLPDSFSFSHGDAYEYRWNLWAGTELGGEFAANGLVAGLSVRSTNLRLIEAIQHTYQGRYIAATADEVTLLIQ